MSAAHIGILAPDLDGRHGWSRYAIDVIGALRDAGVRVTVITARNSPPHATIDGARLLPAVEPMDRGLLARQIAVLPAALRILSACDVIHSLIEPYAPLGALIAGGRPLFITGHGSYVRASAMRRFPASAIYAGAFRRGTLLCVSRYTESAARAALPGVRTRVIGNGVAVARFAAIPRDTRAANRHPLVLFVGAVKARKGVLALVEAIGQVRHHVPGIHCRIVGALDSEPEYVERVRAAIDAHGLHDAVTLTGRIDDAALIESYARADVFVLPSLNVGWKFEGFGLGLLEASAAGLPVIGTRGCGAEDAVIEGVTGRLIDQTDLEQTLAAALIELLTDRDAAARMGAAGRDHARGHTWAHTAAALIDSYNADRR
ncbi:MAG: glycosyltransferase family 4 protein [Chloroflexota bacterium]|nr:glycosyltransferase family 4 protein [Chloroflexota bacterium]